jgi:hypothetical protein
MDNKKNILELFDDLPELKATNNWEQALFSTWDIKQKDRKLMRSGKILLTVTVVLIIVNVFTMLTLNFQQSVFSEFSEKSELEYVADNFLITGNN